MLSSNDTNTLLDSLEASGIRYITMGDRTSEYFMLLTGCDSDTITFHQGENAPWICDKLEVFTYDTTTNPVYKEWYMTVNYHS